MTEFKLYIENMLKGLNVSKKQKKELFEEFMDHLSLLKQELMDMGLEQEDAIQKAIESFGDSNVIRNKLSKVNSFRTLPNVLFGLVFVFVVYQIGSHLPMPAPETDWPILVGYFVWMIGGLLNFIPLGYFVPLIIKRMNNPFLICCSFIIYTEIFLRVVSSWGMSLPGSFHTLFLLGSIFGGILGLMILRIVNNLFYSKRIRLRG